MKFIIYPFLLILIIFCPSKNGAKDLFKNNEKLTHDKNGDYMPYLLLTPYNQAYSSEMKIILKYKVNVFLKNLEDKIVINNKYLVGVDFNDYKNPVYIEFKKDTMLRFLVDDEDGYIKSIDFRYTKCLKIDDNDLNRIYAIGAVFLKNNIYKEIFNFDLNKMNEYGLIVNNYKNNDRVVFESVCEVSSGIGQFNIYRK